MATRSSLYSRTGPWLVDAAYALMSPFDFIECLAFSKLEMGGRILGNYGRSLLTTLTSRNNGMLVGYLT